MAHLSLHFFRGFEASLNDTPLTFATDKARALLAYLAVESGQAHTRSSLAALLWPDYPEENARTTLRHVLHLLRQLLRDDETAKPYLLITRQTLQFNAAVPHGLDVAAFTALLRQAKTHSHDKLESCETCLAQLRQAVELYRGDFLADLTVHDSTAFEEWRRLEQERLHLQAVNALTQLANACEANGNDEQARHFATRLLALEPYSDQACCLLMRAWARMEERNAALTAYRKFAQVLRDELSVEPQPATTELYEAIRADKFPIQTNTHVAQVAPPAPKQASFVAPRHKLWGRSADMAQLIALLERADCQLVTLIGPPGVGKTSLGLQVARQLVKTFGTDALVVVELASISEPSLVLPTIARAVAAPERAGQPVQETLIQHLRDKHVLLVLDNFEQVLAAAPALSAILAQCPQLKILATSRAPLQLREEHRFSLEPLKLPSPTERAHPEQLQQTDVMQLFQERAQFVKPDFQLTQANVQTVAELCIRLDGLPLAIELAAARIRLMTPQAVLARLEKPLNLLRNDSQAYATRQQTLRNAVAWSYALLNEHEQRIFRSLAVFADGFTVDAVEAVCVSAREGVDAESDVLTGIESLLDKSLLQAVQPSTQTHNTADHAEPEPRFRMLESIRAYALEQLEANPAEAEAVRRRHGQFFLALAEQAEPLLLGTQQSFWLKHIQTEHNNFRAALDELAHANNANDAASAEAAMRLVAALRYFWYAADYLAEGLQRSQRALAHPLAVGRSAVRACALNAAGYFQHVLGQADLAYPLMEEALSIGREVGDNAAIAYALQYIAVINPGRDLDKARAYLEESVALFRTLNRPFNLATALVRLGDVAQKQQAYGVAEASYEESIALMRQVNNRLALPFAMRHQAYLLIRRNDLERAAALCTESLLINVEMNDLPGIAACLLACAVVALKQDKMDQAIRLLAASDMVLDRQQTKLLPADAQHAVATLDALRASVDSATFASTYAAGRGLTLQQAVELADLRTVRAGESSPVEKPIAPHPPDSSHNNLPMHLAPFVGRESELTEIAAQLQQPGVRLLTLIGPGGMGKTRLAVEAARARLDKFADGVFFVSLTSQAEAVSIPSAIAAALGLALRNGDPKDALINAVRDKRLLLVLDNFEHVLDGASFVVALLEAAPHVHAIVTSRERLNVRGEKIYLVPGMAYAHEQALAYAATSPAVQLFVQSAHRAYPDFDLNETNLPKVLRLCQLVDGLPLGLELAAAWVEMLPLDTIAAEIERSADFLTSDWRDMPERHRSLRAVFDWSWRLLNEAERKVYRQLSVFRGGFTREAAQAVVDASLLVLKSLSHKSLLRNVGGRDGNRYEIHELLRQFASLELDAAPGERDSAEARHSHYYMAFATARESGLKQNQPSEVIADIRAEIDNFRQAWSWAVAHGCLDEIHAAAHTVWMFYQAAAPLQEQERMFGLAVEGLQAALDSEPAASTKAQSIQQVLSKLLAYYARTFNAQGRHQLSLPLAQRATQVGAASGGIGGVEGEAMGYLVWGQALSRMSQPEEAHERLQRALQLAQRHMQQHAPTEPLRDTEWITYIWLTTNSLALNKPHQARSYLLQGQGAFLTPNNPRGETTYLVNHADVDMALGEYDAARQKLEQALQIARQSAQPWAEGFALVNLGKIMLQLGDYSASNEYLQQGQKVMREMGDAWQQAQALSWLSRLHTCLGAYAQAEAYLQQLADVVGSTPSPEVRFLVEFARACLLLGIGDYEKSLAHAQSASQTAEQAHNRVNTSSAFILVGHSHLGLRQFAQATDVYQQVLSLCSELGNTQLAVEPRAGLAALALAQSDPTALTHVEEALRVLAEHPRAGLDKPFDVYLMCYRVLNAYNDPRAGTVLQTAQRLLRSYAEHIHNDALRRSFEEIVPTHRALHAV